MENQFLCWNLHSSFQSFNTSSFDASSHKFTFKTFFRIDKNKIYSKFYPESFQIVYMLLWFQVMHSKYCLIFDAICHFIGQMQFQNVIFTTVINLKLNENELSKVLFEICCWLSTTNANKPIAYIDLSSKNRCYSLCPTDRCRYSWGIFFDVATEITITVMLSFRIDAIF